MSRQRPSLAPIGWNGDELAEVRRLWSSAARVDAAVGDPNRLLHLLHPEKSFGPHAVRLVFGRARLHGIPSNWHCARLDVDPVPEFLLFFRPGHDFPDSALIFSGTVGEPWWTWHRRPLILQRLRERFSALLAQARTVSIPDSWGRTALAAASAGALLRTPFRQIRETEPGPLRGPSDGIEPVITTPEELYRRVLAAHFASAPGDGEEDRPRSAPALAVHQQRAYERALSIIDRFGGVIVADAVGLGKTYIGLRLLERTVAEGGRGLVIVPAALREQWRGELMYLAGSADDAAPDSTGDGEAPDNLDLWLNETGPVELITMESLGRRSFQAHAHRGADLIVVDEAHNFRNRATNRYRALLDISRHSRLALMTATPINNRLRDLQHLIDLFAAPGAFRHLGVADYREAFRAAEEGRGDVNAILSACVVRRTRHSLRAAYGEVHLPGAGPGCGTELRFPHRAPPTPVAYDLQTTYGGLFTRLEAWFDDLVFPSVLLDPNSEGDKNATSDVAPLLKIILLKRLESSIAAFRNSVIQQLAWCSTALRAIDSGRVLTRPDYRSAFRGAPDDPGGQLALFELLLPAPRLDDEIIDDLRRLLEDDREVLQRVHASIAALDSRADRKLARLVDLLDGPLAGRKVLIFTEFRDTARYLYRALRDRPHVAEIDSGGARLGLDPAGRREVIERFAPLSNGLPEPHQRECVDLLIATDVLSEGLNLQDASAVVSYDLPWNPVRLMQRMGRIDRLGAISDVVELYHFVPADELDRLLGLMERLRSKLGNIESAIGLDEPVLAGPGAIAEDPRRLRRLTVDPEEYGRLEAELEGPLDPEERAYLDYVELKARVDTGLRGRPAISMVETPPGMSNTFLLDLDPPVKGPASHNRASRATAVAYWRLSADDESRGLWLCCDPSSGYVVEDQAGALRILRGTREGSACGGDERLIESARRCCARHVRSLAARLQATRIAGDALRPGLPQCRIAAWLSRHFESAADRLNAERRQIIDDLLDRLGHRFPMATERELARAADRLPEHATWRAIEDLVTDLSPLIGEGGGPVALEEVALLLVVSTC